jgi:hypothetical protein
VIDFLQAVANKAKILLKTKEQIFMTPFRCPYCFKAQSEAERNDRTKTVFWFGDYGKQYAHTQCWIDSEVGRSPTPEPEAAPEFKVAVESGG